ncbi:UvrD-helicase domain-containing protein, partial [Vibrio diabolicus]
SITFSYVSVAPEWLNGMGFSPIKLGLDLRGGVQFLLNVDVNKAFEEQRNALIDEIKASLRDQRVRGVQIRAESGNRIAVNSESDTALAEVNKFLRQNYPGWVVKSSSRGFVLEPSEQNIQEFQSTTLQQNLKIMRGRIEELMMGSASGMWNGTFHGICHRILRAHYLDAKLPEDFQIIDSDDQQRLLKRLIKAQNLDEKQWPARQVSWWINGKKDEGLRP